MNFATLSLLCICFTITLESKISMPSISNKVSSMFKGKKKTEITQQEFNNIQTLELFCDTGNITLHTWKQPNVILEITKSGTTQQLQACTIQCNQHETLLQVETSFSDPKQTAITHMNVIVPENLTLKVATNHGNISIKNVCGSIFTQTEHGSIDIIDGVSTLTAQTNSGNITIQRERVQQDQTIKAQTNHGSITLQVPQHVNSHITAQTEHGKITSDLFITLSEKTIKLNDDTYRQQKKNISGNIVKDKTDTTQGDISLNSKLGSIKIKPYL